jgi:hypothetical protein
VCIVKTLNAGYHIIYRCKKIEHNQKVTKIDTSQQYLIETRGIGGQVATYDNLLIGDYTNLNYITEDERERIFECCKFFNVVEEDITYKKEIKHTINEFQVTAWDDFNSKEDVWDIINDDFKIVKKLNNKVILKRIGSDNPYCGSILLDKKLLYLFTPNTIYPENKGHSAFACYTYKNHNGDFSESAKELYKKGYGTRIVKRKEIEEHVEKIINVEFPIEVFPLDIQDYIIECNRTLGNSIDYMCSSFLWMMSVIFGNSYKIKVKNGWNESPILWLILVGKQGIGKSPSISNIIKPLIDINSREYRKYIKEMNRYDEYSALDKEEKRNSIEVKKPLKKQFIAVDITLEALIELHEANKNAVGVFRDEVAGWIKDMNKYRAGSDVEHWLSSWSNSPIYLNRKTAKSSYVDKPHMPVLGGVQPSIFSQFYTEENRENGFIDRLLISYPELTIDEYNDAEISEEKTQYYNDIIIELFDRVKLQTRVDDDGEILANLCHFSNEAYVEWKRIFNKITALQNSDEDSEYMKSMLPKQKSYIPRFALLIHIFNEMYESSALNLSISKESILKAEKISDYFISMAKKIKVNNKRIDAIKGIIDKNQNKNKSEICNEILAEHPDIDKSDLADILNVSKRMVYKYINKN